MTPDPRADESRSPLWRVVKIALAIVLIPLGIVGLFVPVLQGVLFLLIAVALLSREIPWLARQEDKLRARYPEAFRSGEELKSWARRTLRRWLGGSDTDGRGNGGGSRR